MKPRVVLFHALSFVLLAAAQPVFAVHYELVKGEKYQLCHDYVSALNAMKKKLPMTCEREFPPEFKQFKKIKWEPVDLDSISENRWRQMFRVINHGKIHYSDKEADWEARFRQWSQQLAERIATEGDVRIDRTRIDINADGGWESIYRLTYWGCETSLENLREDGAFHRFNDYFVENEMTGEFDPAYLAVSESRGSAHFSLFYYQGKVFMDSFDGFRIGYQAEQARLAGRDEVWPDGWIEVLEPKGGRHFYYAGICRIDVDYEIDE